MLKVSFLKRDPLYWKPIEEVLTVKGRGLSHSSLGARSHGVDISGPQISQNYKHHIKQRPQVTTSKISGTHVNDDQVRNNAFESEDHPKVTLSHHDRVPGLMPGADQVPGLILEREDSTVSSLTQSDSSSTHTAVASWLQLDEIDANVFRTDGQIGWDYSGHDTDRTSGSSSEWGDDICEHDRQESNRVLQMFKDIEYILFGDDVTNLTMATGCDSERENSNLLNTTSLGNKRMSKLLQTKTPTPTPSPVFARRSKLSSSHLARECRDWVSHFPHMRVLGQQVLASRDLGYSVHAPVTAPTKRKKKTKLSKLIDDPMLNFASPRSCQREGNNKNSLSESDSISLLGRHISTMKSPRTYVENADDVKPQDNPLYPTANPTEEEDILTEGCYEEIIAIDFGNEIPKSSKSISPFKLESRPINKKYPPVTPCAAKRDAILNDLFQHQWIQLVDNLKPLISESLTQFHQSRENSVLSCQSLSSLPPIHDKNMEARDLFANLRNYPEHQPHYHAALSSNTLAGLMQITSKPLQQRERSSLYLPDIPENGSSLTTGQACLLHESSFKAPGRFSMPLLASSSTSSLNQSQAATHQSPLPIDKAVSKAKLLGIQPGGRIVPLSSGRFGNLDYRNRAKPATLNQSKSGSDDNKSTINQLNESRLLPSLIEEGANISKLKLASQKDLQLSSRPGSSHNDSIFSPRIDRNVTNQNSSFPPSNAYRTNRVKPAISRSSLAAMNQSSNSPSTVKIGLSMNQTANHNEAKESSYLAPAWGSNNAQPQFMVNSQRRNKQMTHSVRL